MIQRAILQFPAGRIMHQIANLGGEGASTQTHRPGPPSIPAVVVFPLFMPGSATTCDALFDIYRVAYEQALAALRPSPYELAARFAAN
jgi:hypothetical protein